MGATATPSLEADRLRVLAASLGRARVAEMLAMLRAEIAPLIAEAADPRFARSDHVHALKGAAGSLGAARLAAALAALEAALRADDAAAIATAHPPLAAAARATDQAIAAGDW